MYIFGWQRVAAYTMSWKLLFNYVSSVPIDLLPLMPTVLDTGAICFYTMTSFTVVDALSGARRWSYSMVNPPMYPVLTDNTTIFFSDGQYVIGADAHSGAVTSLSTVGSGALQGYTIVAGQSSTTVIGATNDQFVFANQVRSQPSPGETFAR